jgi:hypothetical protein
LRSLELGSVLPDKAGRAQQALAALVKSERALDADHPGRRPDELTRAVRRRGAVPQAVRRRATCRRECFAMDAPDLERR